MRTGVNEELHGAANTTANECVEFQVNPSANETEVSAWSIADRDRMLNQLVRDIDGIISNKQMRLSKEFAISLTEFKAQQQAIGIHMLRKTITLCVIPLEYSNIQHLSHISASIQEMGAGDNFATHISERLHVSKQKEASQFTNLLKYIWQILKCKDQYTSLDYMTEKLPHYTFQGWYNTDSENIFNQLVITNKLWNTHGATLLCLQRCPRELFFYSITQPVLHIRESHVCGVCRYMKLISLWDASEQFGIPNHGQLLELWSSHSSGVTKYHSMMMWGGEGIRFINYKLALSPHQWPPSTCPSTT